MESKKIVIWGNSFPSKILSNFEIDYINAAPKELPAIEWVFKEINKSWDSFNLDNKKNISSDEFAAFYSHPVWLLNGFFSASDPKSRSHRIAIAEFLKSKKICEIGDYGGGYGELSLIIGNSMFSTSIQRRVLKKIQSCFNGK